MTKIGFQLRKWYLDCVTDNGDAAIAYFADTSWHGVRLVYSSLLTSQARKLTQRTAIGGRPSIATEADSMEVRIPRLKVEGQWLRRAPTFEKTVFHSKEGTVHWQCLQPKSEARVQIGADRIEGLGYAECLTLTIPPWKLPLQTLRWGRFVSRGESLVWIDWAGPYSMRLVLRDGVPVDGTASDSGVASSEFALDLDRETELRSGQLQNTVLPYATILNKVFPSSLFAVEETKWLSRGVLHARDKRAEGWAIHEVVRWKP